MTDQPPKPEIFKTYKKWADAADFPFGAGG